MASILLWCGLTLVVAVNLVLAQFNVAGNSIIPVIGGVLMIIGCVMLILGK